MTIQSTTYFGVLGQGKQLAVEEVERALDGFDRRDYGVSALRVEPGPGDSIRIVLEMSDSDLDAADRDADRAAGVILDLLSRAPNRGHLRERQRELLLSS